MINEYYKRIREAGTLTELMAIYQDFRQAFCDDKITVEQFNSLRMAFHNATILRVTD